MGRGGEDTVVGELVFVRVGEGCDERLDENERGGGSQVRILPGVPTHRRTASVTFLHARLCCCADSAWARSLVVWVRHALRSANSAAGMGGYL